MANNEGWKWRYCWYYLTEMPLKINIFYQIVEKPFKFCKTIKSMIFDPFFVWKKSFLANSKINNSSIITNIIKALCGYSNVFKHLERFGAIFNMLYLALFHLSPIFYWIVKLFYDVWNVAVLMMSTFKYSTRPKNLSNWGLLAFFIVVLFPVENNNWQFNSVWFHLFYEFSANNRFE